MSSSLLSDIIDNFLDLDHYNKDTPSPLPQNSPKNNKISPVISDDSENVMVTGPNSVQEFVPPATPMMSIPVPPTPMMGGQEENNDEEMEDVDVEGESEVDRTTEPSIKLDNKEVQTENKLPLQVIKSTQTENEMKNENSKTNNTSPACTQTEPKPPCTKCQALTSENNFLKTKLSTELNTSLRRQVNTRLDKLVANWIISSDLSRTLSQRLGDNEKNIIDMNKCVERNDRIIKLLKLKSKRSLEELDEISSQLEISKLVGEVTVEKRESKSSSTSKQEDTKTDENTEKIDLTEITDELQSGVRKSPEPSPTKKAAGDFPKKALPHDTMFNNQSNVKNTVQIQSSIMNSQVNPTPTIKVVNAAQLAQLQQQQKARQLTATPQTIQTQQINLKRKLDNQQNFPQNVKRIHITNNGQTVIKHVHTSPSSSNTSSRVDNEKKVAHATAIQNGLYQRAQHMQQQKVQGQTVIQQQAVQQQAKESSSQPGSSQPVTSQQPTVSTTQQNGPNPKKYTNKVQTPLGNGQLIYARPRQEVNPQNMTAQQREYYQQVQRQQAYAAQMHQERLKNQAQSQQVQHAQQQAQQAQQSSAQAQIQAQHAQAQAQAQAHHAQAQAQAQAQGHAQAQAQGQAQAQQVQLTAAQAQQAEARAIQLRKQQAQQIQNMSIAQQHAHYRQVQAAQAQAAQAALQAKILGQNVSGAQIRTNASAQQHQIQMMKAREAQQRQAQAQGQAQGQVQGQAQGQAQSYNFPTCLLDFKAKFEPAKNPNSTNPSENKTRFRLSWKVRKTELIKIAPLQKNYKYVIIHNNKESKKDRLELGMDIALNKKYSKEKDEFSVSLSGAQIPPSDKKSFFRLELYEVLGGGNERVVASRETTVCL